MWGWEFLQENLNYRGESPWPQSILQITFLKAVQRKR
jgi:hypothetical protein